MARIPPTMPTISGINHAFKAKKKPIAAPTMTRVPPAFVLPTPVKIVPTMVRMHAMMLATINAMINGNKMMIRIVPTKAARISFEMESENP